MPSKEDISVWFKELQDQICTALEAEDGKAKFHEDLWERDGGGGGRTRVIQDGNVLEKGGVNFSAVYGTLPQTIKSALKLEKDEFFAAGISIVIHPNNPMVPIIHMNTRYFEIEGETWWFGGGIDLTPHYVRKDQASWFHQQLKNVCDQYDTNFYPDHKKWADDYFYIKHRNETRGVGGIFFDRLNEQSTGYSKQHIFDYVKAVGAEFAPIYTRLMNQNATMPFEQDHKDWQKLRRGRYVEFNLVYDKGTKFGLETSGRIESILMSLPKTAGWEYDFKPEPNSEEQKTLDLLKKEIDWVNLQ